MTTLFLLYMILGTFSLGVSDVYRKHALMHHADERSLLVLTLLLTGTLLVPVILIVGIPKIDSLFWTAFAVTVVLNSISQYFTMRAFKLSDASLIAPIRLIIPILVIGTGYFFLGETPTLLGGFGIIMTLSGLSVLLGSGNIISVLSRIYRDRGVRYGFFSSILFAISFPFDKIAVTHSSAIFATSLIFITLGIITGIFFVAVDRSFGSRIVQMIRANPWQYLPIAVFASIGNVLTNHALNYSLAVYASSLKRLQALFTVLLAGTFLHERDTSRRLVATGIMLAGIIFSVVFK